MLARDRLLAVLPTLKPGDVAGIEHNTGEPTIKVEVTMEEVSTILQALRSYKPKREA